MGLELQYKKMVSLWRKKEFMSSYILTKFFEKNTWSKTYQFYMAQKN